MMKNKRGDLRRILIFAVMAILFSGIAFALYAFPGGLTPNVSLVSQVCNTEIASAASEAFGGVCTATTTIDTNNAVTQTATVNNNNLYMGVRTQNFNSAVTDCGGITNVKLCYEWWSSSASIGTCSASVDANGGGSYSTGSSTCPGTTANPGEICTDVTALESWTCSNFFTASGTRALAYLQVKSTTGGSKTLTVDSLYFNVTYVPDASAPVVSIGYPTSTTYTSNVTVLNFTATDPNLVSCWYSLNNGVTNTSYSCSSGVQASVTGIGATLGSNTWKVWANDSYSNIGSASVTFTVNLPPTISNITVSPDPSGVSATLNITAAGVNDSNLDTLQFYCAETASPTTNDFCISGNIANLVSPYNPYCTFKPNHIAGSYTVYCRMYDGVSYSSTVNKTYTVMDFEGSTSIISVAGDSASSYFDSVNDNKTDILVNGPNGMSCEWFQTDSGYTGGGTACSSVNGTISNCSISTNSQGTYTRYISCKDSLNNTQTASNNLNVEFVLDYTAPTTTSDADTASILVPTYEVTIYESDNVDSDPTTYYCYSTSVGCTPTTLVDNGGIIPFTSSNRGPIYLRYYSVDDAGNSQTIINQTININRLPVFSSAIDNVGTILGGTTVTVSTVDYDPDGQNVKLYVCNSSGATAAGCLYGQYCSAIGVANLSCGFASETDTATHTWYAYIYDVSNESATANNPLTGTYVTDSTGPTITVSSPENASNTTQSSITATVVLTESANWVGYSLDGGANVTMSNVSLLQYFAVISGLSVGNHNLTFYANDSFGNNGVSSVVYFSRVNPADTTAPTLIINSPSNASYASPSGTYVNISSDEALTWAGYRLNGGALNNLTNASSTNWYINLTSLSQETNYTLIVYGNDSSGNQGTRTSVFYADSLAPRYSSLSVSPNPSNQSQNVNCSILWSDVYSISSVIIGENSTGSFENHTISVSGNTSYASYLIVGSKLANKGGYQCQFYATDSAGNINSTTQSFTVNDVTAPTITVTSPGNFTYNQQTIGISLVTNENVSSAVYSLNGSANVSMTNTSLTAWEATLSSLTNGQYSIRFYATDGSGNVGSSSLIYFTVNAVSDSVPPVITFVSPTNLSYHDISFMLNISSNEALTWAGYKLNGGTLTNLTNTSTTSWNEFISGLSQESTNTIIVYANDTSNNQATSTITVYVDTLAPRYSSLSVSPNPSNQSQNVNCSISWTDGFNMSSVIISEDSLGSYENHTLSFSGSSGVASYVISGTKLASAGTYHCRFYATDAAGNINSTTQSFTVNDVTAPTITTISPTNSTYVTTSVPTSIITSENVSSAQYSLDGAANVSLTGSATSWSATLSGLSDQVLHNIRFYATDAAGNVGSSSLIYFTVDTTAYDTSNPVITITSINNGSYYNSVPDLDASSNKNLSWAGYVLNGGSLESMTNSSMTSWSASLSGVSGETINTVVVYGNDTTSNNNQGSKTVVFYFDEIAPRFSSISASPNPANETQNVNCTAYVNDTFSLSSVKIAENTSGSFINHTIDLFSAGYANYTMLNVAKGGYQCIFYATDAAGNINSTTQSFTVNDVTAPTITVTSPVNATYGGSSISASLVTNENVSSAQYSLDGAANVSLTGSATSWSATLTALSIGGHNIIFYATDGSGNVGSSSLIYFTIAVTDTIPPVLVSTISNASYQTSTTVRFNISSNENLVSAVYSLNSGALTNLTSISSAFWNATLSGLTTESTNTVIVYANDTSNNQGNLTTVFYVDTLSPRFSSISASPNPANETQNVNCTAYVNDTFSLSSVKIAENTSGSFINHTIDLFSAGYANYTMLNVAKGGYQCIFYATDSAGNINSTTQSFTVNDVTAPTITVQSPINSTVYSMSSVSLILLFSENVSSANYSLDSGSNISLSGSGNSRNVVVSFADGSHNITFYASDSSGNLGSSEVFYFEVDTETGAPGITIWSPLNGVYYSSSSLGLNISSDSPLRDAAYSINGAAMVAMGNTSTTSWNATYSFSEGANNVTFYANHTSLNNNRATATSTFYVDLNNPSVDSLACNSPANDSVAVNCSIDVSDSVGLDYIILSDNSSGTFVNSSAYDLSGSSDSVSYLIPAADTSPGGFQIQVYLFDLSERMNGSEIYSVEVLDDAAPVIEDVSYEPDNADALDPGVNVTINASITEDYAMGSLKLFYKNSSDVSWTSVDMTNTSLTDYGVIVSLGAGNWTAYVNATDAQGNTAVSENHTLSVWDDISDYVTTTIEDTSAFTLSERADADLLGVMILNNTGDATLNFNITITYIDSSLDGRFNINYTNETSYVYSVSSGNSENISVLVNTTGLSEDNYDYNITITSSAGIYIYQNVLRIQTSAGPYLVLEVITSPESVTRGDPGETFVARLTNYGAGPASTAYGVWVNWTLPSGFTLVSGDLERYFATVNKGSDYAVTNTIEISVSSSITDSNVSVLVSASSINASSITDSVMVGISDPLVIENTVTTNGGGGGGGAGGGAVSVSYSNEIEFVRGQTDSFKIPVTNKYSNTTLRNLVLNLTGFPGQYLEISPSVINEIEYNETKYFTVKLKIPAYKESYEEHKLVALITGIVDDVTDRDYSEMQNIKLIIQEISKEKANSSLNEAEKAILDMIQEGFNVDELQGLLVSAREKLNVEKRNKESYDISNEIIATKEKAFSVSSTIKRIIIVLRDPRKVGVLTGGVVSDTINKKSFSELLNEENRVKQSINQTNVSIEGYNTITGMTLTSIVDGVTFERYKEIKEITLLAIAAFDRGDYSLAEERADNAKALLLLQLKGNFMLFLYSYWYFILLALIVLSITGTISLKVYRRSTISRNISSLDKEEETILNLIKETQERYFTGSISGSAYHSIMQQHQDRLARLRKNRLTLRNKRVKIIAPSEISIELNSEKSQTEKEIAKIQEAYYKDKKINESEYKTQFETMNERLAEVEEEKLTLEIKNKKDQNSNLKSKVVSKPAEKIKENKPSIFDNIKNMFSDRERKQEEMRKAKIKEMLNKK